MNKKSRKAIDAIREIREQNNNYWMALMTLALESNPKKARAFLKKIQANDKKVTKWTGRI